MNMIFIGMVFELICLCAGSIILILAFLKYIHSKNRLTFILFLIFLSFMTGLFFSWLSKVIVLTTEYDYVYNQPSGYPKSPNSWIILRIVNFRISIVFVSIAILFSYILKISIFEIDISKNQKILVYGFTLFTCIFSFFIYQRGNTLLDSLNFLFILLFVVIVYFPFLLKCISSYRTVSNPNLKKRFLSLSLMNFSFLLILFMFLIDRLTILMQISDGFTIFYFLGWILTLFGMLCAYFGYLKTD